MRQRGLRQRRRCRSLFDEKKEYFNMKRRLPFLTTAWFLVLFAWNLTAQQFVDMSMYVINSPSCNQLEIRVRPTQNFSGNYSGGVFTVRFPNSMGGALSVFSTPYGYGLSLTGINQSGYDYYAFSFGGNTNNVNWVGGQEYVAAVLQYSGGSAVTGFELVTGDPWTIPNNANFYQELNGLGYQGVFYAPNLNTPDIPTVSASPASVCGGGSSTLSIVSGNLGDATGWYWYSGSCGGTPVGTGTSVVVSPASTTTYYVRGEGGCLAPGACASVTVTVDPGPAASAGGSATICENSSYTLTAGEATASNGTILWTHNGAGSLADATTLTPTYTAAAGDAGTAVTLTLTVTNNACTPSTATATYTINVEALHTLSLSSASLTDAQTVCDGSPITDITYAVGGGATGASATVLPAGVTGVYNAGVFTISGSPTVSGIFNYTVTTLGSACPAVTANGSITVDPRPTGAISGTTAICTGGSATLSIAVTGTGPWSGTLSDGTAFSGNSSPISVSVSPASTTVYTISTLQDDNCNAIPADLTGSATVTVEADPVAPGINPSPASGTMVCVGDNVSATFTPGSGGAGTVTDTYEFSTDGGNTWNPYNPGDPITATAAMKGINTIQIRSQRTATGSGCGASAYNTVQWSVDNIDPSITCPNDMSVEVYANCQAILPDFTQTSGIVLANSSSDFLGAQGYKNWYYGQYSAFQSGNFTQLPTWTGFVWQDGQSFNTPFLDPNGGHPGVDDLKWAVRRWVSNYSGSATISGDFYDRNTGCGDGAHVRIFQNGVQVYEYLNIPGSSTAYSLNLTLAVGDQIDFAIDPQYDAGCDDTHLPAVISIPTALVASDNCGTPVVTQAPPAGTALSTGLQVVGLTATDAAGNSTTCYFNFNVNDTQLPVINCPANISVNNDPGQCSAVVIYTAPVGTDNCPGVSTALTAGLGSGATFSVGMTTETYTVTAANGQTAFCSFTVTVTDNEAPQISCPADVSVNNDAGQCCAVVNYTAPVGTDNCPGATTAQTAGEASGFCFPVGSTVNTYTVTAANGQTASCSFTVTVADNEAPQISCPASVSVNNDAGQCCAVVNYTAPVGTDNCPGATTAQTAGEASGFCFPVGSTTNTYTVTAANGQTASCSFTVTVTDNEAPQISCPASVSVNNDAGQCCAVVSYTAPAGTDNCPGATTAQTAGEASGFCFPVGSTTNTYTVTAANGQTASCSFTVTVTDNEAPQISCPASVSVNNDAGQCCAVVSYTAPAGTDNCPGATTAQTAGEASGFCFPVGSTVNTYTVTAANGQTASCSFTVTVADNEAPQISCPADVSVNNDAGQCCAVVNYIAPVGTDNCPGATTAQTAGEASGFCFPVGSTTNTYTVTAANGQTASCSFTVTVADNEAPQISCPASVSVNNDAGQCCAVVNYTAPVGTDNCPGATTAQTAGEASGFCFPVGSTTNTYTVTAANGQTASCTFTVTVADNEAPQISCPASVSVNNDAGQCCAVVNYIAPVGTDNCPGATTAQTAGEASGFCFPVGSTTNTYTVTAANGQTASCSFTVTVTDNEAPVISCPASVSVNNDLGQCCADVVYTTPAGTDNCPGATTAQTAGEASGFCFPVGSTVNTYTVTAANGQTASCSFTVTVADNEAPQISCPASVSVNNDAGQCCAVVNYTAPIGTDNCPGATTAQTAGEASGFCFPVGSTVNTYTVTAANGQTASCSFTVTVADNEAPQISCPASVSVNNDAGQCCAVVNYTAPVGTDNCPGATTAQTAGEASGFCFPVGSTVNTYTVTAANGQTASCSFTVTVADNEAPQISCPADVSVNNDAGQCCAVVNYIAPAGTDNCPGATTAQTAGEASGFCFPVGSTTNTYTVTAANGQTASCSFTVTVTDNEAPQISCPASVSVNNDAGQCCAVVSYTAPAGTDNCPGATTAQTAGEASGFCFPVGSTVNTYTVTAANGQTASCSFTVTVADNEAPQISCPADVSVNNDAGQCCAVVNYIAPVGTDNCPGATTAQTAGEASGFCFPVGSTTNTYTVTAANGQTASCSFTVTVADNEAPQISCPADVSVNNDAGQCCAVVNYIAPVGTDNCPGATTAQTAGEASGFCFPVGSTTNTYTVTAANGQTASCSFTVTVADNVAPQISCPADVSVNNDAGQCCAVVNYIAPVGTDNCPGATTAQTAGEASGFCFPVGSTTNTYTVTAANGQTASCSFTVTVADNEAPQISCPADVSVNNDAGQCCAVVNYIAPVGTDNCPGATTAQTAGEASGFCFPVGSTTNTYTVTAANGQTASCSFTVTVADNEAPQISCPADVSVNNDAGQCCAVVNYIAPVGTDNCPGATTAQTAGEASGFCFPVGSTTNTYTVTAANGQTASCSFTVTVADNEAPQISCPADVSVNNDAGQCCAVVNYIAPVGTDNCPGATTAQTAGEASGFCFPVGSTTNTYTVTAANGQTASCSFTVTVADNEAPQISCPADVSVNNDAGQCCAVVNYIAPVGTDNCPGATTAQTAGEASGFCFPVGSTTNTYTVTAANGQTASCSFTVTVADNEAPQISCPADVSVNNDAGQCCAVVNYTAPVGTDNCPGATTAQTAGEASGFCFPVGSTVNTFTVTAANSQTASCSFTVTVTDTESPSITTCPITRTFTGCDVSAISGPAYSATPAASSYAVFSDANNQGVGEDNCGITSVTYVDMANGTCPVVVTRTWTISDGVNPDASCNQTLQVNAPPVSLNCPSDVNLTCQTQSVINNAFANWLNSFGFTGGCNGSGSFDGGVPAAPVCGGSVTVTYRVESDCEGDVTCTRSFSVTAVPIEISILDPCGCLDNATTLENGQLSETIQVSSVPGETWTVVTAPGLYQTASLAPPAAPLPIAPGTLLTEVAPGIYQLPGKHVDAQGYSISVTNGSVTLSASNTCYYPNPSLGGLNAVYCSQDGPQAVSASALLGDNSGPATAEVITFQLIRLSDNAQVGYQSGAITTFGFDPAALAQGFYKLILTFDADDDGAGHPGCVQRIEESFEVRKVGCGNFPWNGN
jgi:hypothetical protein